MRILIILFDYKGYSYYAYRIKKRKWFIIKNYCSRPFYAFDRKSMMFLCLESLNYKKTQFFNIFQLIWWLIFKREKILREQKMLEKAYKKQKK